MISSWSFWVLRVPPFVGAAGVVLVVAVVVLLFARSWDFGDPASPGMLSKVKIVLMHFQIISLLKQYDIVWPPASEEGFSWLSVVDFGPSMVAPECWIGDRYTFWTSWILNVAVLPVAVIVLCMGVYRIAVAAHEARMHRYPEVRVAVDRRRPGHILNTPPLVMLTCSIAIPHPSAPRAPNWPHGSLGCSGAATRTRIGF